MSVEFNESEIQEIERAAALTGRSPAEFARYATLRMAEERTALARVEPSAPATAAPFPSRRSLRPVKHRATMPTTEMVHQLATHLGVQLLPLTVGAEVDEVRNWIHETSEPSSMHERRLREAHEVWQLVVSVESSKTTRARWMGMKDGLGDLSPAEAIAQDRAGDVMAVARYFLEAG